MTTEFLKFTDISSKTKKTKKFEVYSAHDGSYLGYVHWRTEWRRYIMHFESECDWSIECMNQCYTFITQLMQERK